MYKSKISRLVPFIAGVLLVFSLIGCDLGLGNTGDNPHIPDIQQPSPQLPDSSQPDPQLPDPQLPGLQSITYSSQDSLGNLYTLVVTENSDSSARYTAQKGDSFVLTIELFKNGEYSVALTYSGTIKSTETNGTELKISLAVKGEELSIGVNDNEMVSITGTIILDDKDNTTLTNVGPLVNVVKPVIDSITISQSASGNDTIITLTIDVNSNIPVNWMSGSFYGPTGNIWGGGSGRTFTEIAFGHWQLVHTDTVSEYAPNGEYYYTGIKVTTAGRLESEAWSGELKVAVSNTIIANAPVIDSITISQAPSGNDTIITLTIDVSSDVPVNWMSGSFYSPMGNIWGGGSGRTFTEIAPGKWQLVHTDTVSEYAPSGDYYYTNIKVNNAGYLESAAWAGELKVTITNSIVAVKPVIDSITISHTASGNDTIITLTIDVSSNVPVTWMSGSFYGPTGNIWGGGSGRTFTEIAPDHWQLVHTDTVSEYEPSGEYYYTNIKVNNAGYLESDAWAGELKVTLP